MSIGKLIKNLYYFENSDEERLRQRAEEIKEKSSPPYVAVIGGSSLTDTENAFSYLLAKILCEEFVDRGTIYNCGRAGVSTIVSYVASEIFKEKVKEKVISLLPHNLRSILLVTETGREGIGDDIDERDYWLMQIADYVLSIDGKDYVPKCSSFPEDLDTTEKQLYIAYELIKKEHRPCLILFADTGGVTEAFAKKLENKYKRGEKVINEIKIIHGLDSRAVKEALRYII